MAGVQCQDLESISSFLGFAPQRIYALAASANRLYRIIEIPKRNAIGASRTISIPSSELKGVQREILSRILVDAPISDHAWAYRRGRSVPEAAKLLTGGPALLKMDLTDFFPSITSKSVFWIFVNLGFETTVASILTRLRTKDGVLAQGAPTSPALSNISFRKADSEIANLTSSLGLNYVRYSDDIYIYNDRDFRFAFVKNAVSNILSRYSFSMNDNKTRYYRAGAVRQTLGLLTHGKHLALPRTQRRNIRSAFHHASRDIDYAMRQFDQLRGMLEWYRMVYGRNEHYIHYRTILRTAQRVRLHTAYRSL